MLGHTYFYRNLIRTYVVAFGSIFKDIEIKDWDAENSQWTDNVIVPISYGSKEKHLARVEARETTNEGVAITLPRIAFVITGITPDTTRVLNRKNRIIKPNPNSTTNRVDYMSDGVPYDISFELSVMTKKTEDGTKIVEQILPFFQPHMAVTLKLKYHNENVDDGEYILLDAPIILNDISFSEEYDGDFETRRVIMWTMNFTVKGKLYGSVIPNSGDGGPIIKTAITNISVSEDMNVGDRITIIPVVDGKELDEITAEDDFEYLETIETIY
jgi:hypothetical protein